MSDNTLTTGQYGRELSDELAGDETSRFVSRMCETVRSVWEIYGGNTREKLIGRVVGYKFYQFQYASQPTGELIAFTRWVRIQKIHGDGEGYIVTRLHEPLQEFLNPKLIHTVMPKGY